MIFWNVLYYMLLCHQLSARFLNYVCVAFPACSVCEGESSVLLWICTFFGSQKSCVSLSVALPPLNKLWRRASASSLFSPAPTPIVSDKAYGACASEWALTFGKCIMGGTSWARLLLSPVIILKAFCHLLPSGSAWSRLLLDTSTYFGIYE